MDRIIDTSEISGPTLVGDSTILCLNKDISRNVAEKNNQVYLF